MALPQICQLIDRERIRIGSGILSVAARVRVVGEKEPVAKFEGLKLPPNDAAKCGANGCPIYDILSQTSGEQINVTWGVIKRRKPLPHIIRYVAWALIPRAGSW